MKKNIKNNGITLVALVVTLILLLILAGITISSLTGSGLFENAKLAEQKSKETQEKEEGILADYENKIDISIVGDRATANFTFETGDNYVVKKYDNGIMEVNGHTDKITLGTTKGPWGGLYYTEEQTFTFPVTFNSIISINLTSISGDAISLIGTKNATTSSIKYFLYRGTSSNIESSINYNIVGYWK